MFEFTKFADDEAGVTAVEYGGIMGAEFLGIYIPVYYVFDDIKEAAEFLINALSVT